MVVQISLQLQLKGRRWGLLYPEQGYIAFVGEPLHTELPWAFHKTQSITVKKKKYYCHTVIAVVLYV